MENLGYILEILQLVSGVILTLLITFFIATYIKRLLEKRENVPLRVLNIDEKQYSLFKSIVIGIIYFVGFILTISLIPSLKNLTFSLVASSGIIAIIIGFASQQAAANIMSGVLMGVFKPFARGDIIRIEKEVEGEVKKITLWHTIVRTPENRHILIPNSLLTNKIVENATWGDRRINTLLTLEVTPTAPLDTVFMIIKEVVERHPECLDQRSFQEKKDNGPLIRIAVTRLSAGVQIKAWAWARDERAASLLRADSYRQIKNRFDQAGIQITSGYETEKN